MITKTTITNPVPFPTMLPFVIFWIGAQNLVFTQIWLPDRMAGLLIGVIRRKLHDVLGIAA